MVKVLCQVLGRKFTFELDPEIQVAELREVIAKEARVPKELLKIIQKGQTLHDEQGPANLIDGAVLLGISQPKPSSKPREPIAYTPEADDDTVLVKPTKDPALQKYSSILQIGLVGLVASTVYILYRYTAGPEATT